MLLEDWFHIGSVVELGVETVGVDVIDSEVVSVKGYVIVVIDLI